MKKNQPRKRRTPIASKSIRGLGKLTIYHFGTQFYLAVNGVKLESVRTVGSAKRMFSAASEAMAGKKVRA